MGGGLGASGGPDDPSAQQSLGQILKAAVSVGSRALEAQLDALLATLHAQVGWGKGEVTGALWGPWGRAVWGSREPGAGGCCVTRKGIRGNIL